MRTGEAYPVDEGSIVAANQEVQAAEREAVRRAQAGRNVGIGDYFSYHGGPGMWAWLAHRLTGLGVVLFVFLHVVDTALIGWGPAAYNEAIHLYRETGFRIGEMVLFGAVLFHALNGIRIVIIDFWPQKTLAQRKLFWGVIVLFVVLFVPTLIVMVAWMQK